MADNEQVLPMVGELKNLLATEVYYLFKDYKFVLIFKSVPSAQADSDMLPIASTAIPTIGNTLVVRCFN